MFSLRRDGDADTAVYLRNAKAMELRRQSLECSRPPHPIQVIGDGGQGIIVTVQASDVNLDPNASESYPVVKKALRKAIEPVTGDAVSVDHWETIKDAQGSVAWKVWARH